MSDSTLLSNRDIAVLAKIGDERLQLQKEVANISDRVFILEERLKELNADIIKKNTSIIVYENGIKAYQVSESNLIEQRTNLQKEIKKLTRQLKWAKTKLYLFAVVVVGGAAALIIITK